ncbi:hypothetical protein D9611_012576 [Ephemerocybe angulata]|uniref:Protein-S-isoprenylcysteine O-methyltransferase n=1 Tax=Ephemerocybe angulata TaxID=980116 RepID=A0A8H5AUY6_9AGAR|nr:hypothetical protein D9611_012576 [Tulosesus angulatus]
MSPTIRIALVIAQALLNGLACTPPNPTPQNRRYHTEEMYILQIAPLIFKCHQILVYLTAFLETLHYTLSLFPSTQLPIPTLCPSSTPLSLTPSFALGFLAVALGTYIRLDCFATLGPLFTFDLSTHPHHKLVTNRFYSYVRHPAYTGSLLLVFGLAFSHLTKGAFWVECGNLGGSVSSSVSGSVSVSSSGSGLSASGTGGGSGLLGGARAIAVWGVWWAWTLCVGVSRADAEDRQMRVMFKEEWERYARAVPWWFFPGVI